MWFAAVSLDDSLDDGMDDKAAEYICSYIVPIHCYGIQGEESSNNPSNNKCSIKYINLQNLYYFICTKWQGIDSSHCN